MDKRNVRILIVDDHPIVRDGIKTMLEEINIDFAQGYEISRPLPLADYEEYSMQEASIG